MDITIWVRPHDFTVWLVFTDTENMTKEESIKNSFNAYFNNDKPEEFLQGVENSDLEPELYNDRDRDHFDTVEIEGKYGKRKIDFKLVKMSEEEKEKIGEFLGW